VTGRAARVPFRAVVTAEPPLSGRERIEQRAAERRALARRERERREQREAARAARVRAIETAVSRLDPVDAAVLLPEVLKRKPKPAEPKSAVWRWAR